MRIATVLITAAAVSMAACAPDDKATLATASPQDAFWTRLQALCQLGAR